MTRSQISATMVKVISMVPALFSMMVFQWPAGWPENWPFSPFSTEWPTLGLYDFGGLIPSLSIATCLISASLLAFPLARRQGLRRRRREEELLLLVNERTSELRDSQERLRDRSERLREAQEAADLANRTKKAFLANITHELRTPLNSILGYTQLLLRSDHNADRSTEESHEERQRKLRTILNSGEHLLDRINGVLDLSKVESGALMLNVQPVQIRRFLLSLAADFEIRAGQKLLQFTYTFDDDLPEWLALDPVRLRQLLSNLINNAVRFTEKGGISLTVKLVQQALRFEVKDSGIGIPGHDLPHIFEPFFQATNKRLSGQGIGLGLYVSQQILNLWGSKLYVNSEEGRGTTFRFELKAKMVAPDLGEAEQVLGYHGPRKRLLVVDPDLNVRLFLHELLENVGFTVQEASTCAEALKMSVELMPDACIFDLQLSGIASCCRRLQTDSGSVNLIFIATSLNVHQNVDRTVNDPDFHARIPKPIKERELLRILSEHLHLDWIVRTVDRPPKALLGFFTSRDSLKVPLDEPLPAVEILGNLLCHAQRGDVMLLRDALKKIREADPQYDPFCRRLGVLLTEFRMSALEEIIKRAMEQMKLLQGSIR